MKSGSATQSKRVDRGGTAPLQPPEPALVLPGWRIARRLRQCHRAFTSELQRRLDAHDMRVSDWSHLRIIWDEEGLTQVEISRRLDIEKASSTAVLEKLRSQGFVRGKRRVDDRRKVGIFLTAKGRKLIERLVPGVLAAIERATRDISNEDLVTLTRVMDRMTANLQEEESQRSESRPAAGGCGHAEPPPTRGG